MALRMSDLRFALRVMRRRPLVAAVAVLTLALGVGANVTVFSAVRTVLIDDLPYRDPERVVALWRTVPLAPPQPMAPGDLQALQAAVRAFDGVAGATSRQAIIRGRGSAEAISIGRGSPEMFEVLGARPVLGRALGPADAATGAAVAVISEDLWRRQFGGAPDALGGILHVDGEPHTVVGVMPSSFVPMLSGENPVWKLLPSTGPESAATLGLYLFGRLTAGADVDRALQQSQAAIGNARPVDPAQESIAIEAIGQWGVVRVRSGLLLLQGIAGLLLVIACANLANLFLANATVRQRELAVRAALGAGRRRLIEQLLVETSLVAGTGGVLGIVLAVWLVPVLDRYAATALPAGVAVSVRPLDLALGLGLACGSAMLFGILPACLGSMPRWSGAWRDAGRMTSSRVVRILRAGLVTAQVAIAVVVLVGAGLIIRSFHALLDQPLGFDPRDLTVAAVRLPLDSTDAGVFAERFETELRGRLGPQPFVLASVLPFAPGGLGTRRLILEAATPGGPEVEDHAESRGIGLGYFAFMDIQVRRGRVFDADDYVPNAAVAVVNEAFVRVFGQGTDALGRTIRQTNAGSWIIIGIVGDTRTGSLRRPPRPAIYLPFMGSVFTKVAVRTSDPDGAARGIRDAVLAINPELPVDVTTHAAEIRRREAIRAFYLAMLTTFAVLATVLAATGIFGVVAHVTGLRVREFGIRLALGARSTQLDARVVRDALVPVTAGLAAGLGVAWWLGGLLTANTVFMAQLYEVTPRDPTTLGAVLMLLLGVAVMAAWLPARRATRVDPARVLHAE